jgi:hypothetical protein
MLTKRDLLRSAAFAAMSVTTAKSVPASAQTNPAWPNVFEAKAIAEEGFIYGLPIVMNYAVMNEFAVDTKGSQFKAPFNQIYNFQQAVTYKETAVVTPPSPTRGWRPRPVRSQARRNGAGVDFSQASPKAVFQ